MNQTQIELEWELLWTLYLLGIISGEERSDLSWEFQKKRRKANE